MVCGGGGGQKLKVSHAIKIFPVTCVSCQGVRDFSVDGGGGVNFFWR